MCRDLEADRKGRCDGTQVNLGEPETDPGGSPSGVKGVGFLLPCTVKEKQNLESVLGRKYENY